MATMEVDMDALGREFAEPAAEAIDGAKAKALFCASWPEARGVVEALAAMAPGGLRAIIGIIVRAGDAAHKVVCKG